MHVHAYGVSTNVQCESLLREGDKAPSSWCDVSRSVSEITDTDSPLYVCIYLFFVGEVLKRSKNVNFQAIFLCQAL